MPIEDFHPEYTKYFTQWRLMRDVVEGQDAVHGAGVRYLPRLGGQDNDEYDSYKARAVFYGATGRTVDGLTGMIFRKPPTVEDGGMGDFIDDVTLDNDSLRSFAENITKEVMMVGRCGVLVEYPISNTEGLIQAEAERLNMQPYFTKYKAEDVLNWRTERVDNKVVLSEVRLHEVIEVQTDEFDYESVKQLRVLDLFDGLYRVRLYQEVKGDYELIAEFFPIANGANMTFIPFVFFSAEGTQASAMKPPLVDLAYVNISHYQTTADLEHGAHFTGLPTAVITGFTKEDVDKGDYTIGSARAWGFTNPDADAKFLEFTGQGLGALVERMESKQAQMASLGAQMLSGDTRRNESTETAGMRHMGENSILANIAQSITEGLNTCLEYAGLWLGVEPATTELNRDFSPTPMTPQMLTALVSTWQTGVISMESLFENLKRGEVIRHDKEFDEEQDEIQNGALTLNAPQ